METRLRLIVYGKSERNLVVAKGYALPHKLKDTLRRLIYEPPDFLLLLTLEGPIVSFIIPEQAR